MAIQKDIKSALKAIKGAVKDKAYDDAISLSKVKELALLCCHWALTLSVFRNC